jgi:nitroreductase
MPRNNGQAKASLAPTMMKTNREKVLNAAVTVVVLSDLEVDGSRTTELIKDASPHLAPYAEMIPNMLPVFVGDESKNTTTEWAFKNAGLIGMRLLDAATSHGLATAIVSCSYCI